MLRFGVSTLRSSTSNHASLLLLRSLGTTTPASKGLSGGLTVNGYTLTPEEHGMIAVQGIRPEEYVKQKSVSYKELPKLEDSLVNFTLVDWKGERYPVVGLVGDTLVQAAQKYGVKVLQDDSCGGGAPNQIRHSERWVEDVFGEGPVSWMSHVVLPKEWVPKVPAALWAEEEIIGMIPKADRMPSSRLGTEIRLTKELEGLVVYVPDPPPYEDAPEEFTIS